MPEAPMRSGTEGLPASAKNLLADLQDAMSQGMDELKAELTAELRSGLHRLQGDWGDPLDHKSKFRQGLREELQGQLRVATIELGPDVAAQRVSSQARALEREKDAKDFEKAAVTIQNAARGRAARAEAGLRRQQHRSALSTPFSEPSTPGRSPDDACAVAVECHKEEDYAGHVMTGSDASHVRTGSDPCHVLTGSDASHMKSGSTDKQSYTSMHRVATMREKLARVPSWQGAHGGAGCFACMRRACAKLVHDSLHFDVLIGCVIIVNSICIGLQIQWELDQAHEKIEVAQTAEHAFLLVFMVEICIRVLADGSRVWESAWFLFDLALVSVGVLSSWIVEPIVSSTGADFSDGDFSVISQVLIIRVLRLLRLIRSLRLLEAFQELWKLASGLMGSIRTVLLACLLIAITVYIFAGLGIELITRSETLRQDVICMEIIDAHFRSLPITMLTLVQFANADSIAGVYMPLISKAWYLAIYFGMVWLVVTISLMNLVTGVIVDRAISLGHVDREMDLFTKRKMLKNLTPAIQSVFRALDKNGNGVLELCEVKAGLKSLEKLEALPAELQDIMKADTLTDLFEFLDADGSGEVDQEEFLDGVFHLVLQTIPLETTQVLQLLRTQGQQLQLIRELARMRECQEKGMSLCKDHDKGCRILDVGLDLPAVEVRSGGRSERRSLRAHTFRVHLDAPLRNSYPRNATVFQIQAGAKRA